MQSKEEVERVLRLAQGEEAEKESNRTKLLERIEQKRGQVYSLEIAFKEADPQGGDYGQVRFKLFTMHDVAHLVAQPIFQRAGKVVEPKADGSFDHKPLTEDEQVELFKLHCEMLSRVLVQSSAMTKKQLIDTDDYRFVEVVFAEVSERSGLGARAQQDIQEFFRH